jgi:hypothetical protein
MSHEFEELFVRGRTEADLSDLNAGQLAPMPDRAVVALPAPVFKGNHLLVLPLLKHFASDGGTFNERCAVREILSVAMKQHVREDAFLADFGIQEIYIDDIAFGDAVLSTAGFDNCERHGFGKSRAKSHADPALTSENKVSRADLQSRA